MRPTALALAALLPSAAASADCQSDIAAAMHRASALPPTAGRAALMEQIQRADVARHEGDDGGCADEIRTALGVLDSIDDAKRAAAAQAQTKAAAKADQKSVGVGQERQHEKDGASGRN